MRNPGHTGDGRNAPVFRPLEYLTKESRVMLSRPTPRRSVRTKPAARPRPIEALEDRRLLSVSLVSVGAGGTPADPAVGAGSVMSTAMAPSLSDDGRFVAFVSEAGDLVPGDTNSTGDVFVRDRQAGTTTLVSVAADGQSAGNAASGSPGSSRTGYAISGNGRFVVFASEASNLVPGLSDNNNQADYFVRDLQTNTTSLVTATPSGGFSTSATAGGTSGRPAISDDGRFIAFTSTFADLDPGVADADDGAADVFVRDTTTNTTRQLSRTATGAAGGGAVGASPTISSDGRYVAFTSNDQLLPGLEPGQFIFEQVWVYDTTADTVVNASLASDGTGYADADSALPQISGDGRSVAFLSGASNLVAGFTDNNGDTGTDGMDVYLRDLDAGATKLVSHDAASASGGAGGATRVPSVSFDGRFVAYVSRAKNLVTGVTDDNDAGGTIGGEDLFLFDATTGQNELLSANAAGTATSSVPVLFGEAEINAERGPAMSDDGRYVVFASAADDLVANDTNPLSELFVRDVEANTTRRIYADVQPAGGGTLEAGGDKPGVSGNGSAIAFIGNGIGIVGSDVIGTQVFVDAATGDGGGGGDDNQEPGTLVPTVFTELPDSVLAGGRVRGAVADVTVTNVAVADYSGPVTVTLFASTDETLDGGDAQITTLTRRLRIPAADAKNVRVKIPSFPQVPDGTYVVVAQVSGTGVPPGASTSDEPVQIAAPFVDLSGAFASVPATVTKGKRARVAITVTNNGNVNAKGTVPVAISASTDAGGAGATPVSTVNARLNLKPGASRTIRLNVPVPAETAPGTYFVLANLDATNALAESNETNNTLLSGTTLTVA